MSFDHFTNEIREMITNVAKWEYGRMRWQWVYSVAPKFQYVNKVSKNDAGYKTRVSSYSVLHGIGILWRSPCAEIRHQKTIEFFLFAQASDKLVQIIVGGLTKFALYLFLVMFKHWLNISANIILFLWVQIFVLCRKYDSITCV